MKKIFPLLYFVSNCFVIAFAQESKNNFHLIGTVSGRDTGRIVLIYRNDKENYTRDTTFLENGRFSFQGKISQPTFCIIRGAKKIVDFQELNYVGFFIEEGLTSIALIENDYEHAKIEGSDVQKELEVLKSQEQLILKKYKPLYDADLAARKELKKNENDVTLKFADSVHSLLLPSFNENDSMVFEFISSHPASYVSAFYLGGFAHNISIDSVEFFYSKFPEMVKDSRIGKGILNDLLQRKKLAPGNIAPDFTRKDIRGKQIELSSFKGKCVLLDFWASWCIPCRKMTPYLKQFYGEYNKTGFDIISISVDTDRKLWAKAIKEDVTDRWHHVPDDFFQERKKSTGDNASITKLYMVGPIPVFVLIDKNGSILGRWEGQSDENIQQIEEKLKQALSLNTSDR